MVAYKALKLRKLQEPCAYFGAGKGDDTKIAIVSTLDTLEEEAFVDGDCRSRDAVVGRWGASVRKGSEWENKVLLFLDDSKDEALDRIAVHIVGDVVHENLHLSGEIALRVPEGVNARSLDAERERQIVSMKRKGRLEEGKGREEEL